MARGRLIFRLRGKIFSEFASDKNREQIQGCHRERSTNCHGEESFKTTRPSVSKEIASVTMFHRNDKKLVASVGLSWRGVF